MSILLRINGYEYTPDVIKFPAGEVNVNFLKGNKGISGMQTIDNITIVARLRNSDDIMELLLLKNALDNYVDTADVGIRLSLLYIPYARQDRICNKGEAHSLRVMCDLINNMNFREVLVVDAHSIVSTALINNCTEVKQETIISEDKELSNKLRSGEYIIVSPDAGSEKKCMAVAKHFGCNMIRATKVRDIATGKIQSIEFVDAIPEGKNFLIVDDICDGGGTFIPLAELLYPHSDDIDLYVTHGIFSKTVEMLHTRFNTVYTTDSYYEGKTTDKTKVIEL